MLKQLACLFFALAALHHLTESLSLGDSSLNLQRRYNILSQALKHGDPCSWEAEEARQNYTRLKTASPTNSRYAMQLTREFMGKGYVLCSGLELFVCDRESQKCVCGDAGYEALYGVNRSLYILEKDGKCHWKQDTYCVSDTIPRNRNSELRVDSKCQSGTTCRTRDNQACSFGTMTRYLFSKYQLLLLVNKRFLTDEMFSGRVCTCQANSGVEWEGDWYIDISKRRKRSLDGDEEVELKGVVEYAAGSVVAAPPSNTE